MKHDILVIHTLAKAFSVTDFSESELADVAKIVCPNAKTRWLGPLVERLCEAFSQGRRPLIREIEEVVADFEPLQRALQRKHPPYVAAEGLCELPPPRMMPASASLTQALPIHDFSELAQALELHSDDLGWLTAPAYLGYSHYHCFWQKKQSGSERRLIESPKPLLKLTQNIIREKILEPVPEHEAANGFVRGKSIFDYVKPHVGRRMVLKLDLKDFFPGVTAARVIRLFMTIGYPEPIANLLTALTTHRTPQETLKAETLPPSVLNRFEKPHIPQGAPTSPTLANLCAFRLDCRLAGLARASGIRYTRYADDLLFSGGEPFRRNVRALYHSILTIVIEEGFQPHMQKTRFMPSGRKQHAAGLVLNEKPNISRVEYDRLKAILTNSLRYGPDSQNREKHPQFKEHLAGRIGWFRQSNPKRAERLDTLFEQIEWGP